MEKQIIDSNAEKVLSPEWFTIEAKKYANVDIETKPLYEEFRKKIWPRSFEKFRRTRFVV